MSVIWFWLWPDGEAEYFRGEAEGTIVGQIAGNTGFVSTRFFPPDGYEEPPFICRREAWQPGDASAPVAPCVPSLLPKKRSM